MYVVMLRFTRPIVHEQHVHVLLFDKPSLETLDSPKLSRPAQEKLNFL